MWKIYFVNFILQGGRAVFTFWRSFLYFSSTGFQLYVSLRLLRRPTPKSKLVLFALLQTIAASLGETLIPFPYLQFALISFTHMAFHMWIFQVDLFPEAIFCYTTPIVLGVIGELLNHSFFPQYFAFPFVNNLKRSIFIPPFSWSSFLPSILVACYFWINDHWNCFEFHKNSPEKNDYFWCYMFMLGSISILPIIWVTCLLGMNHSFFPYPRSFFFATILIYPLIGFTLYQYMHASRQTAKRLQYLVRKSTLQKSALRTLREERHDFLNELALISTYVEMDKKEEALSCIAYTAASLSERYNYSTLPDDAWLTVLELKQKEAERRSIQFTVDIQAELPQSFTELRLLPKLITNLIDNAFYAVAKERNPQVTLTWKVNGANERTLSVSNNGPMISPWEGMRIFQGGVTSKENLSGNSGWGLVICKRIAQELGGILSYESDQDLTVFTLTLPSPGL